MKKSNRTYGTVFLVVGLAQLLLAILLREKPFSSYLFGLAGGLIGSGGSMLIRYLYWTRPKNRERYKERLETEKIELQDELKAKLRDKAGRYAYMLGLLIVAVTLPVLGLINAFFEVEGLRFTILYLGTFLLLEYVAGIVIFRHLLKKY